MANLLAKRKTANTKAKRRVPNTSLVRLKKQGSLYAVTVNGRTVSKFMPKPSAEAQAKRLRSKAAAPPKKAMAKKKNTAGRTAAKVAAEILGTFDVNRDGRLDKADISKMKAAADKANPIAAKKNPARIRIADILPSNGEQTVDEARKRIKSGFRPKRPWRPVSVVKSRGGKYILTDGFHRTAFALENGRSTIAANVSDANLRKLKNPGLLTSIVELAIGTAAALDIREKLTAKPKKKRTAAKPKAKKAVRSASQKKNPGSAKRTRRLPAGYHLERVGPSKWVIWNRGSNEGHVTADTKALAETEVARRLRAKKNTASPKKAVRSKAKPAAKKNTSSTHPAVTAYRMFHTKGLEAAIAFIDKAPGMTPDHKARIKRELREYNKPAIGNPQKLTRELAWAAATDAGNRHMRKAGRTKWSKADLTAAAREFDRLWPLERDLRSNPAKLFGHTFAQLAAKAKSAGKSEFRFPGWMLPDAHAWVGQHGGSIGYPASGDTKSLNIVFDRTRQNPKPTAKRNPPHDDFQGRPSTRTLTPVAGPLTPKTGWILGRLLELRVRGYAVLDFRTKKFYLWADNANKNLYIAGGRVANASPGLEDGYVLPLGKITHVEYETEKTHLGDPQGVPSWYRHRFGEEGGELPDLVVDKNGYGYFEGGSYTITPLGIRD